MQHDIYLNMLDSEVEIRVEVGQMHQVVAVFLSRGTLILKNAFNVL